jgi:hypothetical protein
MLGFRDGDLFAAYLKRHGFVGIGTIKTRAKMIRDVNVQGKPLLSLPLRCKNMKDNMDNENLSEYVCLVEWIKTVPREKAKWRTTPKLYTTTHVRASLDGQPNTIAFLENEFSVGLSEMIAESEDSPFV